MTKLPMESRDVTGVDGPDYTLNVVCAAPGCSQRAAEGHHIWRRSELGGAYAWVSSPLWSGLMGNLVGLCPEHHRQITVNSAWLSFDSEQGFTWSTILGGEQVLEWTPPFFQEVMNGEPDPPVLSEVTGEITVCPSCKRPLPHPRHEGEPEPKRPRRTWSITVPKDERENGAEVLDELLVAAREEMAKAGLPYGEESSVRYFVLTAVLGLFVQNAKQVLSNA